MTLLTKITITIFALSGVLVLAAPIYAQENPEQTAKKLGINFPISELGNCTSYSSCRSYCEDANNREACTSFAKKKRLL